MKKRVLILSIAVVMAMVLTVVCLCGCNKGNYLQEDATFKLNTKANNDINFVPIPGVLNFVLDPKETFVTLGKDGSFKLQLKILSSILKELNGGEGTSLKNVLSGFGISLDEMIGSVASMDLSEPAKSYAEPILPGFTFDDLEMSFGLLESLDAKFIGVDFSKENIQKMAQSVKETGHLNADIVLPEELGIEINSTYEVVEITDYKGEVHTTIQVAGNPQERESYLIFEMRTNKETGKRSLFLKVEFLQLTLVLAE